MTQPRLVGERYELGELIGYGGMAEVHRGRDLRLDREVAIKVLRPDLARDPAFLVRFRREAQSAAGLNHPSIVSVYDTGEDAGLDGAKQPFIVMEFVEGRTLRDILKAEGRLPPRRAMEITADVCGALDFSHRAGIVHRDIKPANVMITDAGAVKVMDFGIARAVADQSATVTQTANVIGTAQYLSPEQARGETVDARSDVYSTGCLLYELITGVPPFQGDSPVAVAYQHVRENPIPPSQRVPAVPRVLDSIVMKALAKNQLNRYQSAGEMRADLQRALADEPVSAEAVMTDDERTQLIARTPPPVVSLHRDDMGAADDERRPGLVWLVIVVALLLVIGAAAFAIRLLAGSGGTKTVTVPSIIGMTQTAAAQALKNDGLVPATGDPTSGPCAGGRTVNEGLVCLVTPEVGAKVKDKSTVTLQVFEKRKVQLQTYVGEDYTQAANEVNGLGLHPVRHDVNSAQPVGTVVQQSPPPYATVVVGSTVTLQVSTGKVVLPDVRSKPVGEAQTSLNTQGWTKVVVTGGTVSTTDKAKDGTVALENPQPGIAYPQSTQVTLTAYKYLAPTPTSTPTPTCTPTTPPPTTSASASPSGSSSSRLPPTPSGSPSC